MILASSVRKGLRNLSIVGLSAIAVLSLAVAAVPGFPFTEDFSSDALKDASTTADWDTVSGTLKFALATELTGAPVTRVPLGGLGEVGETSRDIVLGDLDGDGDLDAVVGSEGSDSGSGPAGEVNKIYENNNGVFDLAPIDVGTNASITRGMAIGDLNRDGTLDLVAGNFQGQGVYYLNDGTGNLSVSNYGPGMPFTNQIRQTWKVGLVDVDSDGDLDYIEGNAGSGLNSLYRNMLMETGSLSFSNEIRITNDRFNTRSIAFGDIDRDGDTDIIAGDQGGVGNHIYRWFGDESRFVARDVVHTNANITFAVELADLDGDGYLDLVEGNAGLPTQIYFNQGLANPGFFNDPVTLSDSNGAHVTVALVLRDLDRDGDIDLVEGNNGSWDHDADSGACIDPPPAILTPCRPQPLRVFLNNGDGSFANGATYEPPVFQKIYGMAAGDVDNDGKVDFIAGNSTNNVPGVPQATAGNAVYFNDGAFGANTVRQLDGFALSALGIDIDGGNAPIPTATLTVDATQPAFLADVDFYLSNDNGATFLPATPGIPVVFPNSNGSQLKWKVDALSSSPNATQLAEITELSIAANRRPNFNNIGPLNATEGQPVSGTQTLAAYFSDPDGDTLTYQMTGLPAGTGISLDAGTGQLGGVPTNADFLASPITLTATAFDGAQTRSGNITLNITQGPDDPPTANDDGPYAVDEGGAIASTFNVLDNDTDPENAALSAVLVDPPLNSALFELKPDGTFDYTHDGGESATDSFTYRADDGNSQSAVATVSITINPINDPPVISLVGQATVNIRVGDGYTDLGAGAQDAEDGDISANIVVGGDTVNTAAAGTYVITYNVTDSGGAPATQVTRTVVVATDTPPVITLLGSSPVNLTTGDAYTDAGATATDAEDGDISANIVVGGDAVNTAMAGTYIITYNVTDSASNAAAEVTRTVNVTDPPPPPPPPPPPSGGGGGLFGLWELAGMMFAGLLAYRRRRDTVSLG